MSDFDIDNMGGTSISTLNDNSDIELDYSTILNDINTIGNTTVNDKICEGRDNTMQSMKKKNLSRKEKKNINMNNFVRNLETNLDNLGKSNNNINSIKIKKNVNITKDKSYLAQFVEYKYLDILISMLLFLLLNNKLTIETIYRILSLNIDNPYPNLIIRTIIFGALIFLIKKYYLA